MSSPVPLRNVKEVANKSKRLLLTTVPVFIVKEKQCGPSVAEALISKIFQRLSSCRKVVFKNLKPQNVAVSL